MSVSFSDIQAMLAARPPLAEKAPCAFDATLKNVKTNGLAMPAQWIDAVQNIARIQQKAWPQISHPRVALYASSYGQDNDALQARLEKLAMQQDPLTRLCAMINADLRVYELDLTAKVPEGGLTEVEACHALSYGLMTIEEHVDCLIVETLSAGASDVISAWEKAMQNDAKTDPMVLLQQCGAGHDLFALLGAIFAARMAKIPVFGCGQLHDVLPIALARLLPNDPEFCLTLPSDFAAGDTIQTINGMQTLQLVLAFGPQQSALRVVMPNAA